MGCQLNIKEIKNLNIAINYTYYDFNVQNVDEVSKYFILVFKTNFRNIKRY